MSSKRQATTELNHDNWDQEDPTEQEEAGGFKMATKEVLEKRVIRTAKRRSQATSEEAQKSVFSGFSGFNKAQKPSFDFLSNLTNGNKSNSGSTIPKSDTAAVSSSSMIIKPASSPSSGIFSLSGTSTPITKSAFGQSTSESIFGGIGTSPVFAQSVFTSSKPDSTVIDSPFKGQSSVSSTPIVNFALKPNSNLDKPISQVSSTLFGVPSTNANNNNSPFSASTNNPNPFKTAVISSSPQSSGDKSANKSDIKDDKKLIYYTNLKGLNDSVSAWIKKHVEETPLCILTPIFRDYEKHLKDIQDEYEKGKEPSSIKNVSDTKLNNIENKNPVALSANNSASAIFSNNTTSSNSLFSSNSTVEKTSNFTFGINTATTMSANNLSTAATPSTGFSFGIKPSSTSSPFGTNTTTATNNGNAPFSFGTGKPFAFNSNIKKSEEQTSEGDVNEDEPPKVEYKPIAEENSIYDRKCKVFVKKDGNFIDKGVGTLYIKKIEESGKHQLLVRANTSLGNILVNMILSSSIPTQRMGKNNVMMVCMPTPDSKPPPTSVLIRVKTSEDADELLETLNKFKA